jgi:Ca2+-transporting ATPase
VVGTLGLQLAAVYVPFMQRALHTVPLNGLDWVVMLVVAAPLLIVSEIIKRLNWRRRNFTNQRRHGKRQTAIGSH